MVRFEKVQDGFFVDFDEISVVMVEEQKVFNDVKKEVESFFDVVGVTKMGQRLPVPLFRAESLVDAESFIEAYLVDRESMLIRQKKNKT